MSRIGIRHFGLNPAEIVDLVDLAESLGYESAWVSAQKRPRFSAISSAPRTTPPSQAEARLVRT